MEIDGVIVYVRGVDVERMILYLCQRWNEGRTSISRSSRGFCRRLSLECVWSQRSAEVFDEQDKKRRTATLVAECVSSMR